MKKIFLLFVFLYIPFISYSQHLLFLGIPIDGTITDFQKKLATKGIRLNSKSSNEAPVGQRIYNGKFQGYNSEITVYYSRKSKKVYKVGVEIESKKKEVIQQLLEKTLHTIENKYNYASDHVNEEDGRFFHFKYIIFPNVKSNSLGAIHVIPTFASDYGETIYIIKFIYEDAANTSILKPSETEPSTNLRFLICGEPEKFFSRISTANQHKKNECYDECIKYLTLALDYYKYGCPPNTSMQEDDLENEILSLKKNQIGRIKTAWGKEYANVYRIADENGKLKYIEFCVNSGTFHVKLTMSDIKQQIFVLEILMELYAEKKKSIIGKDWGEMSQIGEQINLIFPALIGNYFNNRNKWEKRNLDMRYRYYKQELHVDVYFDEYEHIFLFRSLEEIQDYLLFLKSVQ